MWMRLWFDRTVLRVLRVLMVLRLLQTGWSPGSRDKERIWHSVPPSRPRRAGARSRGPEWRRAGTPAPAARDREPRSQHETRRAPTDRSLAYGVSTDSR